ncbi:hypothetical protein NA78x_001490 [Anatilimnocola sp. NA78]|uniref:DUF7336 domain-containing protein n=1 Tax=Anatilimnocola sp. NA78 TaxID=3415683 RepID=UPI003CE48AF8
MNTTMESVFLVQHVHLLGEEREDVKLIGAYSTSEAALAAVHRLRKQPGFCDYPILIDDTVSDAREGFTIDEYPIDRDHWAEGFVRE